MSNSRAKGLKFIYIHIFINKVNVTQVVNTHCKVKGCDKLYIGQTDKTNYKIVFPVHIRKAYRRGGIAPL